MTAALPCASDPESWFADATTMEGRLRVQLAIDSCRTCPALEACMKQAKKVKPQFGVWAGRYYTQRRSTRRDKMGV